MMQVFVPGNVMVLFMLTVAFLNNLDEDFIQGWNCHFEGIEFDALCKQFIEQLVGRETACGVRR